MASDRAGAQALLDSLAGADPYAVMEAVRACTDKLRAGDWDASLLEALTEKLAALAGHESPRPRQAVAEGLPYLPDPIYASLLEKLSKDPSPYVRAAAERAPPRRTALLKAAVRDEEHDARVTGWYEQLDPRARKIAERIAAHETEYYVRRMHHEVAAQYLPIVDALDRLEEATHHPEIAKLRALFEMVRHIHDDARKNTKSVEPDYRVEPLRAIVESQASLLPARFPDRAERIAVDLSGIDGRIAIEIDASYLKQAFGNILKNAVEAYDEMPGAPIEIAVSARESGTDAVIVFADDGCGMGEQQIQHAFVPFGSSKPGGTGFGLFLARRVARQIHGGDLALASRVGVGTTVTMTLPLRQETTRKKRGRGKGSGK